MPFQIVRNDITKMQVDAIVCPANEKLQGGGGTDGAIRAAAGPELEEACRALGGCEAGRAKLTDAYRLPCRYVIHAVGPRWRGGLFGEAKKLRSCYDEALRLAAEQGCESLAFPLISAGSYGFPKEQALRIATEAISAFVLEHDMRVYLVLFGSESLALGKRLFNEIEEFISDNYVAAYPFARRERKKQNLAPDADEIFSAPLAAPAPSAPRPAAKRPFEDTASFPAFPASWGDASLSDDAEIDYSLSDLDRLLDQVDESFQQMLLRKIDESGMSDAQCYKKANLDRKLFSKIRKDVHYRPSKPTAIAFAVALELDLDETRDLLQKAGFALSHSSKFDLIIEYFIRSRNYNIFEINEALYYYDQSLLGA